MKISLVQLRLLAAIAETGGVGAAARRMRLTQSGASQSIAKLEKILGAELITRTSGGAALTAFGRSVLADARAALSAVDRIETQARSREADMPRRLRVAAIPSQMEHMLPGWRKAFLRLYPDVDFSAFEGGHDDVGQWVRDGIADLGITSLPLPELEAAEAGREELVVVGRRDDPLIQRWKIAPEDLAARRMISSCGCEAVIEQILSANGENTDEGVRTHDVPTALEMVRNGVGMTMLSEISLPGADMRDLRALRLDPPTFRTVYVVSRPDSPVRPLIGCFRELVCGAA